MSDSQKDNLTRRDFLRTTTCSAAAAGMGAFAPAMLAASQTKKSPLPIGMLGRTKHPATLISFGSILIRKKLGTRILKRLIDSGVNLVHTSPSYQGGKSILSVGDLFRTEKSYRDKVFLCVKSFHPEDESEVDDCLRKLGTDHIDAVLTTLSEVSLKRIEAIQAQQDSLKKKGKVRHTGFVCHKYMNEVIELVLEKVPDYFDMTLMAMAMVPAPDNPEGDPASEKGKRFLKNIKALRQKGTGILSMKSGARKAVKKGPKLYQAHVKAILEAGADSVLTSMNAFEHVETITKLDLTSPHLTAAERQAAAAFRQSCSGDCLMCGQCALSCPKGLPVSDLMRIRSYPNEPDWQVHARAEFAALNLNPAQLATTCSDCTTCTQVCPIGLAGAKTVRKVASQFT